MKRWTDFPADLTPADLYGRQEDAKKKLAEGKGDLVLFLPRVGGGIVLITVLELLILLGVEKSKPNSKAEVVEALFGPRP